MKNKEDTIMLAVNKKEHTIKALEFIIYIKTIFHVYSIMWFTICPFIRLGNIYLFIFIHTLSLTILYNNNLSNYILALTKVKNIKITNNIDIQDVKNIKKLCEETIVNDFHINKKYFEYKVD